MACRTVISATSNSCASALSDGILLPTSHTPLTMRSRTASATCVYRGLLPFLKFGFWGMAAGLKESLDESV